MPICPTCKSEQGGAFCSACGTALQREPTPAPVPPPFPAPLYPRSSPKAAAPAGKNVGQVLIWLVVIVGGVGWFATHQSPPPAAPTFDSTTSSSTSDSTGSGDTTSASSDSSDTSCGPENFKTSGVHGTVEDGFLTVVGTIVNTCSVAMGVQVKFTTYDTHGNVLNTDDEWPASVSNIPPHQPYPFKLMTTVAVDDVKFVITPDDVRQW